MSLLQENTIEANYMVFKDWLGKRNNPLPKKYQKIPMKHFSRLQNIGNQLKLKMQELNFSRNYIAKHCDIDNSIVKRIEDGCPNIPLLKLITVLEAVGCTLYVSIQKDENYYSTALSLDEKLSVKMSKVGFFFKKERKLQKKSSVAVCKIINMSRPTFAEFEKGGMNNYLYDYFQLSDELNIEFKVWLDFKAQ